MGLVARLHRQPASWLESVLHDYCFHFGVLLQSVLAQFAADSGLLEPAERRGRVEHVVAVYPHGAGANIVGDRQGLADVACVQTAAAKP